jgi:hypothetical protein
MEATHAATGVTASAEVLRMKATASAATKSAAETASVEFTAATKSSAPSKSAATSKSSTVKAATAMKTAEASAERIVCRSDRERDRQCRKEKCPLHLEPLPVNLCRVPAMPSPALWALIGDSVRFPISSAIGTISEFL